jgi:hypothetical protein
MKINIIVGLLAFSLICPLLTFSQQKDVLGWREARWGMTEEEILKAFKGEVKVLNKKEIFKDMYASVGINNYDIEGDKYTVFFQMDDDKKILKQINISATGDSYSYSIRFKSLAQIFTEKYGTPSFKDDGPYTSVIAWNFRTSIIELTYMHMKSPNFENLTIIYHPPKGKDKILPDLIP